VYALDSRESKKDDDSKRDLKELKNKESRIIKKIYQEKVIGIE
jgi:hypothetical protein